MKALRFAAAADAECRCQRRKIPAIRWAMVGTRNSSDRQALQLPRHAGATKPPLIDLAGFFDQKVCGTDGPEIFGTHRHDLPLPTIPLQRIRANAAGGGPTNNPGSLSDFAREMRCVA